MPIDYRQIYNNLLGDLQNQQVRYPSTLDFPYLLNTENGSWGSNITLPASMTLPTEEVLLTRPTGLPRVATTENLGTIKPEGIFEHIDNQMKNTGSLKYTPKLSVNQKVNGYLKSNPGVNMAVQAAANVVGNVANKAITDGYHGKAADVANTVLSTAGGVVGGVIGGPFGAALGTVAGNVLGGVANRAIGYKTNDENIAAVKGNIAKQKAIGNQLQITNDNSTLVNAYNSASPLQFSKRDLGRDGWFRHKIEDMEKLFHNRQNYTTGLMNHGLVTGEKRANIMNDDLTKKYNTVTYAYGGLLDYMNDMPAVNYDFMNSYLTSRNERNNNNSKLTSPVAGLPNAFAIGGDLQTHGADWSTGSSHIDAGGTHEENPNQGVQVGVDNQGTPNLVEEGEIIYNDYVYSQRITLDNEAKERFNISKKKEITYADEAKVLEKEISERPNDPISKAGYDAQMQALAEEQERQKAEMQAQEAQEMFAQLSPEEQVALMQQMAGGQQEAPMDEQQAAQEQMAQEQMAAEQGIPQEAMMQEQPVMPQEGMVPEGIPIGNMGAYGGLFNTFGYGGNLFRAGGDVEITNKTITPRDIRVWLTSNSEAKKWVSGLTDSEIENLVIPLMEFIDKNRNDYYRPKSAINSKAGYYWDMNAAIRAFNKSYPISKFHMPVVSNGKKSEAQIFINGLSPDFLSMFNSAEKIALANFLAREAQKSRQRVSQVFNKYFSGRKDWNIYKDSDMYKMQTLYNALVANGVNKDTASNMALPKTSRLDKTAVAQRNKLKRQFMSGTPLTFIDASGNLWHDYEGFEKREAYLKRTSPELYGQLSKLRSEKKGSLGTDDLSKLLKNTFKAGINNAGSQSNGTNKTVSAESPSNSANTSKPDNSSQPVAKQPTAKEQSKQQTTGYTSMSIDGRVWDSLKQAMVRNAKISKENPELAEYLASRYAQGITNFENPDTLSKTLGSIYTNKEIPRKKEEGSKAQKGKKYFSIDGNWYDSNAEALERNNEIKAENPDLYNALKEYSDAASKLAKNKQMYWGDITNTLKNMYANLGGAGYIPAADGSQDESAAYADSGNAGETAYDPLTAYYNEQYYRAAFAAEHPEMFQPNTQVADSVEPSKPLSPYQTILNALGIHTQDDWNKWAKDNDIKGELSEENINELLGDENFRKALAKSDSILGHALSEGYNFGNYKPETPDELSFDFEHGGWGKEDYAAWDGSTDAAWLEAKEKGWIKEGDDSKTIAAKLMETDAYKRGTKWLQDSKDNRLKYLQAILKSEKAPKAAKDYARKWVNDKGWIDENKSGYDEIFGKVRTTHPGTYWKTPNEVANRKSNTLNWVKGEDGVIRAVLGDPDATWGKPVRTYTWQDKEADNTYNYYEIVKKAEDAAKEGDGKIDWSKYDIKRRPEFGGIFGIAGPIAALSMMSANIGKPKPVNIAPVSPVLTNYQPVGNYLRYDPMNVFAPQVANNAKGLSTERYIRSNTGPLGAQWSAMIANNYAGQLANGELGQKAYLANAQTRGASTAHNAGIDQYNAKAHDATAQYNASALNEFSKWYATADLQRQMYDAENRANWYNSLYGNIGSLSKALAAWDKENRQYNMIAGMIGNELFGPVDPESPMGKEYFKKRNNIG